MNEQQQASDCPSCDTSGRCTYACEWQASGEVPDWALREFCNRANLDYGDVMYGRDMVALRSAVRAGGRLIAAHEPAPVDPLGDAVIDAMIDARIGPDNLAASEFDRFLASLRARGVTVAKGVGE